jgi:hypothetical protein
MKKVPRSRSVPYKTYNKRLDPDTNIINDLKVEECQNAMFVITDGFLLQSSISAVKT